jgi:hypothetical protein
MALTPEAKAAHEELELALQKVLTLQGSEDDGPLPVLVDWLVVVEGMKWDDDGDSVGYHNVIFRGGQVRLTVALGLLEVAHDLLGPDQDTVEDH